MRLTMRAPTKLTMCCAAALFTLIAIVFAPSAKADTTCDTLLTSGTGTTFLKNCISKDGNVVAFESPQDAEHIAVGNIVGSIEEGYAICQGDAQHPLVHGFDVGQYEYGFGASTVLQPNGPNTLPLTITRDTDDGLRLKQSFARNTAEKELTITMTLSNVSASTAFNVQLIRFVDFNTNGSPRQDIFYKTQGTVIADKAISFNFVDDGILTGIALTGLTYPISHFSAVEPYVDWLPPSGPPPAGFAECNAKNVRATPTDGHYIDPANPPDAAPPPGDYAGRVTYSFGNMAPGASKTVKVRYGTLQ